MSINLETPITGGITGLVGVFLGWFGFKTKVCGIEKTLDTLKQSVRYVDTCDKVHEAVSQELQDIKSAQDDFTREQSKMQKGIATLLERTKNL